jgi:phosphate transport system permease protein
MADNQLQHISSQAQHANTAPQKTSDQWERFGMQPQQASAQPQHVGNQRHASTSHHISGQIVRLWAYAGIIIVVAIIVVLFAFILSQGASCISWDFITQTPGGDELGSEGGIAPAIIGSLWLTGCALVLGGIPALVCALYLTFYCRHDRIASCLHVLLNGLAGTPSIIFGLFSYSFIVQGLGIGRSVFAAGSALALMIFPFIEIRIEKAFQEIPHNLIATAYALGCSRLYVLRTICIPCSIGDIAAAFVLGGCYAMGATAPLMFTGGVAFAPAPQNLTDPAMALPLHLYLLVAQGDSMAQAYGTAFVLMIIILIGNALVAYVAYRRKKQWNNS